MSPVFLLSLALAQAPPPPPPVPQPPTLPPVVATAKVENGEVRITVVVPTPVQRRVTTTKTLPDGKTVEVPATVTETYPVIEPYAVPLARAGATDLAGKAIAPEALAGRLKQEAVVVLVPGPTLEPRYRKVFRDDVVVLTHPGARKGGK